MFQDLTSNSSKSNQNNAGESLLEQQHFGAQEEGNNVLLGVVESQNKYRMLKLLFRVTRGRALTFFEDFENN